MCTAKRPPILFSFENLETNWQQKLVSWYLAGAPGWQDLLSGLAIRWKVFLSWPLLDGRICYRRLAFIYGLMTLMAGFAIGHSLPHTHTHKIPSSQLQFEWLSATSWAEQSHTQDFPQGFHVNLPNLTWFSLRLKLRGGGGIQKECVEVIWSKPSLGLGFPVWAYARTTLWLT